VLALRSPLSYHSNNQIFSADREGGVNCIAGIKIIEQVQDKQILRLLEGVFVWLNTFSKLALSPFPKQSCGRPFRVLHSPPFASIWL
jgi:hypothetical protein